MGFPSFNRIFILGRLIHDPYMYYTGAGAAVCTLRLVTWRRWRTKTGSVHDDVCYFTVVCRRMAEACGKWLHKGDIVHVDGRVVWKKWEDKETKTIKTKYEVVAHMVTFISLRGQVNQKEEAEQEPEA